MRQTKTKLIPNNKKKIIVILDKFFQSLFL